jgi:threonine aldolase
MIDLRSDTVTRPTPEMREAIAQAEVGDDVYGEDPTVNALQQRITDLTGKEAALFVASGTQANQIALKSQTQPGDEVICEYRSHIFNFEAGSPALLSGIQLHPLQGHGPVLDIEKVRNSIRPDNHHFPQRRSITVHRRDELSADAHWPVFSGASYPPAGRSVRHAGYAYFRWK